jgi:hypothetical protein
MLELKEYKDFIDMLESGNVYEKDVYQDIMTKEKLYLEQVNKMLETKASMKQPYFSNFTVGDHYMKFIDTLRKIFKESLLISHVSELPWIFLYGERKIYIGVLLVILSMFLFFISISN